MNEQKKCPFCGSGYPGVFTNGTAYCSCPTCSATAISLEAWNTRAAPTMKAWEWVEGNAHGPSWHCDAFDALIYAEGNQWRACVGQYDIDCFESKELAQSACVAYVEGKLKEWLV